MLLLILPDFLARMMPSKRVKSRMAHSDTSAPCHPEQGLTVPTPQLHARADSHIPHAGWPESEFTAQQRGIRLGPGFYNERGALGKDRGFSGSEFTSLTEQSFRERAATGEQQGQLKRHLKAPHGIFVLGKLTPTPSEVSRVSGKPTLSGELEPRQVLTSKPYRVPTF